MAQTGGARWSMWTAHIVAVLALGLSVALFLQRGDAVTATEYVLVDDNGTVLATLADSAAGPALTLVAPKNREAGVVVVASDGQPLARMFVDAEHNPRVELDNPSGGQVELSTVDNAAIVVRHAEGSTTRLLASERGAQVRAQSGTRWFAVDVTDERGTVELTGSKRASARIEARGGKASFQLARENLRDELNVSTGEKASMLSLRKGDDRVLMQAGFESSALSGTQAGRDWELPGR